MEKWAERIAAVMDERGLKPADLSRAIKVSQPSLFQWFKPYSGKPTTKMITAENLLAVSRFLQISPEWILHGRGPRELSQYVGLDVHKLEVAIISVRRALEAFGLEMEPVKAAALISYAYREAGRYPDKMSKEEMQDFDALIRHNLRGEPANAQQAERPTAGTGQRVAESPAPAAAKARAGRR